MRVIVSLTTLPTRYDNLWCTIESIKNQTIQVDDIYLCIPNESIRCSMKYPRVPEQILQNVRILNVEKDYGPICKIIKTLEIEKDPETIIITLDDDIIYPNDLIERLVNKSLLYPNSAIGGTGIILGPNILFSSIISSMSPKWNNIIGFNVPKTGRDVDILCGVSGILYKRKFFPEKLDELLELVELDFDVFKNDDVLLSSYLGARGVSKKIFLDLPIIKNHKNIKDTFAISNSRIKFLHSFWKATISCKNNYNVSSQSDTITSFQMYDSLLFRIIIIIIVLILLYVSCFGFFLVVK